MKMDNIKLSKILSALGFVLVFTMIFINFTAGLKSSTVGIGAVEGAPSLFSLMFGGSECFAHATLTQYLNKVSGLKVAFAFEIVGTVLLLICFVAALINKNTNKIVGLINGLAVLFIITAAILSLCTKAMVKTTLINQLTDNWRGKDVIDAVNANFNKFNSLGAGAIINGIFGILSVGSIVASRVLLKKNNNVVTQ